MYTEFIIELEKLNEQIYGLSELGKVIYNEEDNSFQNMFYFFTVDSEDIHISFEDHVPTSIQINSALKIVPMLEKYFKLPCEVDLCYCLEYEEGSDVTGAIFENNYKKSYEYIEE